jgi:hypothetical protein
MVKFLIAMAPLRRDLSLAGYFSQVFDVLTEGCPKLFKNFIQLCEVSGNHSLSRQFTDAIVQASA